MATTDYLNLEAMRPQVGWKPEGMLGGYLYGQQEREYQRLLEQTEMARRMALEKQQQELREFQYGSKGRMLGLDNAFLEQQGRNPYVQSQAAEAAQADIAKNQSFRRMIPNTEARQNFELDRDRSLEQLRRAKAGAEFGVNLLTTARELGPIEGLAMMQAENVKLKQSGQGLPQHFLNPQQWDAAYRGAVKTIESTTRMIEQAAKDAEDFKRTKYQSDSSYAASVDSAKIRATTANKERLPRTHEEAYYFWRKKMADADTSEEREYARKQYNGVLINLWQKDLRATNNIEAIRDQARASQTGKNGQPTQAAIAAQRRIEQSLQDFKRKRDADKILNAPTAAERNRANPQPGTSTTPPPPSGFQLIR